LIYKKYKTKEMI